MVEPKIGDHYWVYVDTTKKDEIAICIDIDNTRQERQGRFRFTYSHWGFNGYNHLTKKYMRSCSMKPFSKVDYILYGRKTI